MNKYFIIINLICMFFLQSCSPINILATGTSAGAVVAESNRTVGEAVDDTAIKIKIAERYAKSKKGIFLDVNSTVKLGKVYLTGIVESQDARVEAVKLVWEINGVDEVINEIEVGNSQNLKDYSNDLWITTQIKTKTITSLGLDYITFNFESINGKVFVMGIASNKDESEKVIEIIRDVKGVKSIVNHIIIKD
tara:strand:+ start:712 stop:1290 length:579 start_codon:yes stop_codon:yes gene_type:complete